MSTKVSRTQRREEMLAHVAAQEQSGMTRKAFCRSHGLALHALDYWRSRMRRDERSAQRGFAPVEVSGVSAIELHYPNGVCMVLPAGTALEHIAACIRLY